MSERIIFPEWRKENEPTKYPFSNHATLLTQDESVFAEGLLTDAAIYPVGGQAGIYLSEVVIDHETVTVWIGDPDERHLASGEIPLINPPNDIVLTDVYGRPAGILVSTSQRLAVFQSWGVGTHEFRQAATEFAGTVCFPTPELGLRGLQLENGDFVAGDVWLVGGPGVVLRPSEAQVPGYGNARAIRVDVVGDPLFRRRLCQDAELFVTPQFIQQIRVIGPNGEFTCTPDANGNLIVTMNNDDNEHPVIRTVNTEAGLLVDTTGVPIEH